MRINLSNLKLYLSFVYKTDNIKLLEKSVIEHISSYLQNDYGLEGDCSITSIATLISFLEQKNFDNVYNKVETEAKRFFYKGKGTIPFFIKFIASNSSDNKKFQDRYIKNFGFRFSTIKNLINDKKPIILSLFNDGRNYYKNHTVLIVGYEIWQVGHKKRKMLIIYDNWTSSYSYIDYNKLSKISTICY